MHNGGMQKTRDCPHMAAPCACTTGGNTTIINGDEAVALDFSVESMSVEISPLGEDDSHVQGIYVEQNFAGS